MVGTTIVDYCRPGSETRRDRGSIQDGAELSIYPAPSAPLTLTPRLTHNPRADAQDGPIVPGDLESAVAPSARRVTARDRERRFCYLRARRVGEVA